MSSSAIYKLRHSRPQWYRDYHQWPHHTTLHWTALVLSVITILTGLVSAMGQFRSVQTVANAANTTVTSQASSSTLDISSGASATLSGTTVSTSGPQSSTGSLGTVTVTDNRGTGAGWSATATSTNFSAINAASKVSGNNNTVTSGGTYTGSAAGTYTIPLMEQAASGWRLLPLAGWSHRERPPLVLAWQLASMG